MATTSPPAAIASLTVAYPERPLNRLTSALRMFTIVPIAIVLCAIAGGSLSWRHAGDTTTVAINGTGLLVLPPLLMLVFRRKYPRWWFAFNRELVRFGARVAAYASSSRSSSRGSRSCSRAATRAPSSTTSSAWGAGTCGCWPTPSS